MISFAAAMLALNPFDNFEVWFIVGAAILSALGGLLQRNKGKGKEQEPAERPLEETQRAPRPPATGRKPTAPPPRARPTPPRTTGRTDRPQPQTLEDFLRRPPSQPRPAERPMPDPARAPAEVVIARAPAPASPPPAAAPPRRTAPVTPVQPAASAEPPTIIKRMSAPAAFGRERGKHHTLRRLLSDANGLRTAILLQEIISPPLALREQPPARGW